MPMVSVGDLERAARERLPADVWDYVEGGSGAELTVAANREAFRRVRLRPRVMVDVSKISTASSLLGDALDAPIGIAPTAYHRLAHPDGEVATAVGAGRAGALYVVSIFASRTLEEVAAAATGPLWLQFYWLRDREAMAVLARRAAVAGYRALVLTVDTPVVGRRPRDMRNGFVIGGGIRAANLDPELMASAHQAHAGASAIARHSELTFDPSLSWTDLAWLREASGLPVVVKGVLTAEDARLAVAHGAAGVVVSNHGGRQLDRAVATLDALPEVVDAVAGAVPVLVDGGVRDGADVFAALALGADAVLVGRPAVWSLAVDGADGVAGLLGTLRDELAHTMMLAGRPTLADVDRSAVVPGTGRGTTAETRRAGRD